MVARLAHVDKIALGDPTEQFLCQRRIGIVFRDVAGTAIDDLVRDLHAVRVFIGMDDVEHAQTSEFGKSLLSKEDDPYFGMCPEEYLERAFKAH